jgi:hypothetical protein
MMLWRYIIKAPTMARLTITLSDERRRALREAAVKRGKTISQLIEESLELYGIARRGRGPAPRGERDARRPAPMISKSIAPSVGNQ